MSDKKFRIITDDEEGVYINAADAKAIFEETVENLQGEERNIAKRVLADLSELLFWEPKDAHQV